MSKRLIFILIMIILSNVWLYCQPTALDKEKKIKEEITEILHKKYTHFTGAILVAKENEFSTKIYQGYSNIDKQIKIDQNTSFGLASMGKLFTMMSILKLVEQGRISLNDKLIDFVSGFRDERAKMVTIRHLLTHTSGWEHYWQHPEYIKNAEEISQIADYLPFIKTMHLDFTPGEKYQYSNVGYILLGAIIESISKQEYHSFVAQQIFEPMDMKQSSFAFNSVLGDNFAKPITKDESLTKIKTNQRGSADGGAYSSILDIEKLIQQVFVAKTFLTEEALKELMGNFNNEENEFYEIQGGFKGVSTSLVFHDPLKIAIVVLSNQDPPIAEELTKDLINLLQENIMREKAAVLLSGRVKKANVDGPISYANIGIANKGIGTASDINGLYKIEIPKTHFNDTLTFSALGFKTIQIPIKDFLLNPKRNINMEEIAMDLDEVTVHGQRFMTTTEGLKNVSPLASGAYIGGGYPGAALVSLIESPKYPAYIKKVNVHIRDNNKEKVFKLRLRIMAPDANGNPGKDLLLSSEIIESRLKKGWISFDLNEHLLEINTPVFIGIEWIEEMNNKVNKFSAYPRISSISGKNTNSFARTTSLNKWRSIQIKLFLNADIEF